jgi:hypothetical protein
VSYSLGIDLGTTFTAAAVYENGQARIIDLSDQAATMPSIIYLDENGSYLVGDSAMRRAATEPARAAQQFKRRFGDTAPIFIGGAPLSADALTAELLKSVIDLVSERQGGPPDAIALTHPANWGGYKLELFDQTVRSLIHRHRRRPSNTARGTPDFGTIPPPTPDLIHGSDSVQSANWHRSGALAGRRNLRTSNQLARERTGGDARLVDHFSAADRDVVAIDALNQSPPVGG